MSTNADYAIQQTLVDEGVLSNHAADPGGLTKYGVTQRSWMGFLMRHNMTVPQSVADIDVALAKLFYMDLWHDLGLDMIGNKYIAAEIFDSAVNCGQKNAVRFAQRACNWMRKKEIPPELLEDGYIGAKTRNAIAYFLRNGYTEQLLLAMNGEQYIYYKKVGAKTETSRAAFSRGWMKRLRSFYNDTTH